VMKKEGSRSGDASPLRDSMRQSHSKDLLNNAVHINSHLLRINEQSESERSSRGRMSKNSSLDVRNSLQGSSLQSIKKSSDDTYTDMIDIKSTKVADNSRSNGSRFNGIMSDPRWSISDKNKLTPTKHNTVYPIDTYEFNKSKILNKTRNTVSPGDMRQHHIQKISSVDNGMDWKLPEEASVINESKERDLNNPSPTSPTIKTHIRRINSANDTTSLNTPVKKPYEFGKRASAKFVTTDCVEVTKPSNVPKLILPGYDMKRTSL